MDKKAEVAALTAALVVFVEVASSRELNHALVQDQPHDHREATADFVTVSAASPVAAPGEQRQFAVLKVEGSNPEEFWIALKPGLRKGSFMNTIQGLGENEVRPELVKMGIAEEEITYLILKARAKPR